MGGPYYCSWPRYYLITQNKDFEQLLHSNLGPDKFIDSVFEILECFNCGQSMKVRILMVLMS